MCVWAGAPLRVPWLPTSSGLVDSQSDNAFEPCSCLHDSRLPVYRVRLFYGRLASFLFETFLFSIFVISGKYWRYVFPVFFDVLNTKALPFDDR